jgi:hypothetical protein
VKDGAEVCQCGSSGAEGKLVRGLDSHIHSFQWLGLLMRGCVGQGKGQVSLRMEGRLVMWLSKELGRRQGFSGGWLSCSLMLYSSRHSCQQELVTLTPNLCPAGS